MGKFDSFLQDLTTYLKLSSLHLDYEVAFPGQYDQLCTLWEKKK